ncbi:zinc finger protein BRUTUS-like At1g18910 isoform X2 [Aristolochia californica]|uniref:zinc finger protein BRUTUS-like At1g18910 isoform X2 n=1 Tax=Aristolochia californica TaxID=171875 RepID=UPI0035D7B35E
MGAEMSNSAVGSTAGVRLVDSPIMLLVCFHKALGAELAELHLLAENGRPGWNGIPEFRRRYEFLQLVYKYHCTAEDEVIFQALDLRTGNTACTYSLEHNNINDLFDLVFYWLDQVNDGCTSFQPFQELAFCARTVKTAICHHMQKEEEQVFPMLKEKFSLKEQALLVWQFISNVPIMLLRDSFPWMASFLSPSEQVQVLDCIKQVVPKEELLHKMVMSWLDRKSWLSDGFSTTETKEKTTYSGDSLGTRDFPLVLSIRRNITGKQCCEIELDHLQNTANSHPINGLRHWHSAIRKELEEILEELMEIRRSKVFLSLSSISSRVMFVTDIIILYSDALEKVMFPALKFGDSSLTLSLQKFPEESQIKIIHSLIQNINSKVQKITGSLMEELCWQLGSFVGGVSRHFSFQESKVFPMICKMWDHDTQRSLLCASLQMMPLGLLKCVIVWLSTQLTEEEAKTLLCSIKLAAFASLLHEWLSVGYSGKTSLERFRKELQEMFKNRSTFIPGHTEDEAGSSSLDVGSCQKLHAGQMNADCPNKLKDIKIRPDKSCDLWLCADPSCLYEKHNEKCNPSYSNRINLQVFLSRSSKKLSSFPSSLRKEVDAGPSATLEHKPIDHIFHFHRALEDDLQYFVQESGKMVENVALHLDFTHRFQLVRVLYEAHSNSEDEVIFPALEAKGAHQNIAASYILDHKLEAERFENISTILDKISELQDSLSSANSRTQKNRKLWIELHGMCKSMQVTLCEHMQREETGVWPLILKHFSEDEQEKLIGDIMGRTRAEILQTLIPRLMECLTPVQQQTMLGSWCKATKNTMFGEWLKEWWEGVHKYKIIPVADEETICHPIKADALDLVAAYLSKEGFRYIPLSAESLHNDESTFLHENFGEKKSRNWIDTGDDQNKGLSNDEVGCQLSQCTNVCKSGMNISQELVNMVKAVEQEGEEGVHKEFTHNLDHFLSMSQDDKEAAVRKLSHDTTLDPQEKTNLIQNLLMSRWLITQKKSYPDIDLSSHTGNTLGQCPSYRDSQKSIYGCRHYKRNCKLLASCCNQLFTCRYCHDDVSDHSMDRKSTIKMMCMKCLYIQPIGQRCSNTSCNASMSKYFCCICKLFDDERDIYHCPFCNLCRVGRGLGIDYFHCMNCNACMSKSLSTHICREKCFESNCPICFEDIFTSSSPVKALSCGHLMHSTCFQDYTCTHYTCPICSKSLGDMKVYFGMLDALLAEEKIPEEYLGQTQGILCNDCQKRGTAPFHWLYHKCTHCGSYNTRLL